MKLSYLDEFLSLNCAPDLLAAQLFPNAKEITETFGAWHMFKKHLWNLKDNPNIVMWDIGCGSTPRTTAFFAFMTRWRLCTGIDPVVKYNGKITLSRTKIIAKRVEEIHISTIEHMRDSYNTDYITLTPSAQIITAVHAHVSLPTILRTIKSTIPTYIIAIPCCIKLELPYNPVDEYRDNKILSPHNLVRLYQVHN